MRYKQVTKGPFQIPNPNLHTASATAYSAKSIFAYICIDRSQPAAPQTFLFIFMAALTPRYVHPGYSHT
eukprot:jgi/Chrzof1/3027/Cz12g08210.t1